MVTVLHLTTQSMEVDPTPTGMVMEGRTLSAMITETFIRLEVEVPASTLNSTMTGWQKATVGLAALPATTTQSPNTSPQEASL